MELKTFIKQVLIEIADGVREANKVSGRTLEGGKRTHPFIIEQSAAGGLRTSEDLIEFDIAVTASESRSGKGGGGLKVYGVGIGGEKASSSSTETASRIRFKVAVGEKIG